ncbi:MAG: hypothetical protein CM1200mP24_02240 [Gammaproteobacteria bacterium]|nr:MAG: hypothetical protein CM1200mP24_02240 [Gammaproteobacteria bacterium]
MFDRYSNPPLKRSFTVNAAPKLENDRIQSLDILRGFAVLGILLINIIGFGLPYATLMNPGIDIPSSGLPSLTIWLSTELLAEGSMRCLFSILFGAGVVLFIGENRPGRGTLHYRRSIWLLGFGVVDAYLLLWFGDVLMVYALTAFLLFFFRNAGAVKLLLWAGILFLVVTLVHAGFGWALENARELAQTTDRNGATMTPEIAGAIQAWSEFASGQQPSSTEIAAEMSTRTASYISAFYWNLGKMTDVWSIFPIFFLDALAMMLLGMGLFKFGVLQGELTGRFYVWMVTIGFATGIGFNSMEVNNIIRSEFDILTSFPFAHWTYQLGRLGLGLGYLGTIILIVQSNSLIFLTRRLAAVGRLALTNYLMQSLICLLLFTGAGLGLLGELDRAQLYPIVLCIWLIQLWFSSWWLKRYYFGPLEWLWRLLTYGNRPRFSRSS